MADRRELKGGAMVRTSHIVSAAIALLMILPGMVWGYYNDELSRETLKGIMVIWVEVAHIKPEIEKAGLTISQMQTDVELKLHLTRLNVEHGKTGWPRLLVYVNILKTSYGAYVYVVNLELEQLVYLERSKKPTRAATWSTGVFGIVSELDKIRSVIKDRVDVFLNAWLSVNPQ